MVLPLGQCFLVCVLNRFRLGLWARWLGGSLDFCLGSSSLLVTRCFIGLIEIRRPAEVHHIGGAVQDGQGLRVGGADGEAADQGGQERILHSGLIVGRGEGKSMVRGSLPRLGTRTEAVFQGLEKGCSFRRRGDWLARRSSERE